MTVNNFAPLAKDYMTRRMLGKKKKKKTKTTKQTNAHLALVFLGSFVEVFHILIVLTGFLAQEDEQMALDITSKDLLSSFLVKVGDQWKGFLGNELFEFLGVIAGQFSFKVISTFVEL